MAKHKLKYGIEIIDKLFKLGQILEYHCEKEHPVDKENESAVDVAWLYEEGQKYPLFIFEIESATTNSILANPSKIFGEPNQKFEKPLFLFHLLLKGGQDSGKISQLENLFGTHNYRIYRFSLEEKNNLIIDILSQHRRLTNSLNIVGVISELIDNWQGLDIDSVIQHIENLEFEISTGKILPSYACLTQKYSLIKPHFLRKLKQKVEKPKGLFEIEEYNTYLGNEWPIPVYLGLLSAFDENGQEKIYFNHFVNWQEKSSYLKQIGPSFGLSRDYDLFILGMSGAIFGLTASLFYKVDSAKEYLANELYEILIKSERYGYEANIFNALWLLHISPNTEKGKEFFNYSKSFINDNGGIPETIFNSPLTNYINFLEGDESLEEYGEKINIPDFTEFQAIKGERTIELNKLFEITINYLIDNEDKWNPITAGQL